MVELSGVRAWYKPFKFAMSVSLYSWSMALYCSYLPASFNTKLFSGAVIVLLAFDIFYIAFQASKREMSHCNISTTFNTTMLILIGLAATIVTLWTGYIAILFFIETFQYLPLYYVWGIRIGLSLFVIFSLEGFVMGANGRHTVGARDGGVGLPVLGWSLKYGDLRTVHFIGMHALQVLPLLSFFVLKDLKRVFLVGILYTALAVFLFLQATKGHSFIPIGSPS